MSKALYERAMTITDPDEARACFAELVADYMRENPDVPLAEAQVVTRTGLGYFAGYFSDETRARVERLFECEHPIFGSIAKNGPPTSSEAFTFGLAMGRHMRGD